MYYTLMNTFTIVQPYNQPEIAGHTTVNFDNTSMTPILKTYLTMLDLLIKK